jgi:transposase
MAEPVRARRLSDREGQRLQQIVRRGKHGSVRVHRAMIIMASSSGTPAPAIARLVAVDEDTIRDVIHLFNEKGLTALDPQQAGRPRLISDKDTEFIVTTATTRQAAFGQPFTHWSLCKLAAYLAVDTSSWWPLRSPSCVLPFRIEGDSGSAGIPGSRPGEGMAQRA